MPIDGKDYLFYKAFPISVGIIRATTRCRTATSPWSASADAGALAIAMAARNSGGVVIAQVGAHGRAWLAEPARQVKVPGVLVDAVVVATDPAHHMQTFVEPYSAAFAGGSGADGRCAGAGAESAQTDRAAPRWSCVRTTS